MSDFSSNNVTFWDMVKPEFRNLFSEDVYNTWFGSLVTVAANDTSITLGVPNEFAMIWIEDNYLDIIKKRLQMASGQSIDVKLKVIGEQTDLKETQETTVRTIRDIEDYEKAQGQTNVEQYSLNPKNTFDNFVIGSGNQMAHAACIAVSNAPGRAYNPLFLYGDTGLGKTHLMHAVAHKVLETNPKMKVVYTSTEKFTNEFINALQQNMLHKFRQKYRSVDLLLIDDIHFLSGKERIQEEFFHTFNELFESQKQIFLSSDRPASEIAKLESRLISRFQWGLVTDIQAPDLETRMAILAKKASAMKLILDPYVIEYMANKVSKNVRKLEGALIKIASFQDVNHRLATVLDLDKLFGDLFKEENNNGVVTIDRVQQKVADFYKLKLSDMLSKKRPANIAFPRQVAMYLCRIMTTQSLSEIGQAFGGRDHGTVIHACKTVESLSEQDKSIKRTICSLQELIGI